MKIVYRLSEIGYNKIKPAYINNESCLKNFTSCFKNYIDDIYIILDNCSKKTIDIVKNYVNPDNIQLVSIGHGAGTFNLALDKALTWENDEIVYFVENDYIHRDGSDKVLIEGIELGADFISLYDHPDKYMNGINPYVENGGEITKVFLSKSCHWKLTNSTTMTFASTVKVLKQQEFILRKYTSSSHPYDFNMWIELRNNNQTLITPIPSYSTHGETNWLAPLINWNYYANSDIKS